MDLGTHDGVADHPHRLRARRRPRRARRAAAVGSPTATTVHARRRRALRADEGLPLGRDHAEPDDVQPARTPAGVDGKNLLFREQGTPPVRQRRAARLRRAGRVDADARRRTTSDRRPPRAAEADGDLPGLRPDRTRAARTLRRHRLRQGHRRPADLRRRRARGRPHGVVRRRRLRPRGRRGASGAGRRARATRPRCCARRVAQRKAVDAQHRGSRCPATRCCSAASPGASRTSPSPCRRPATCRSGSPTPARSTPPRRARSRRPAGSVPAGRTTRGCSRTDGEYTGFAAVASRSVRGDRGPPAGAARRQRGRQRRPAARSCTRSRPDGQVYFGANSDAGNTDETAKFPSVVALVWRWTGDNAFRDEMYALQRSATCSTSSASSTPTATAGPRALGNVEREGMGEEKLDNTVYTIRGLRDLADMAASKGDAATAHVGHRQGGRPGEALRRGLVVRLGDASSTPTRSTTRATPRSSSGTGSA